MLLVLKTVKIVSKQVFLCVIKVMLAHLTPESRDPRTAIYEEKELEREKGKEHNVIKEWWKILGNWLDANGCSWCRCKPFVTKNRCLNVFPIHHFVGSTFATLAFVCIAFQFAILKLFCNAKAVQGIVRGSKINDLAESSAWPDDHSYWLWLLDQSRLSMNKYLLQSTNACK